MSDICAGCDKTIEGTVLTALDRKWHPEHFICTHCKKELGEGDKEKFYEKEGKPYCKSDYKKLFAPQCAKCKEPILGKCVSALDKNWHPEHFVCAHCGEQFGDDSFHEKDGKVYCKKDYLKKFAPKCAGCDKPLDGRYMSALSKNWHHDCFVCQDCKTAIKDPKFAVVDGKPQCTKCAGVENK